MRDRHAERAATGSLRNRQHVPSVDRPERPCFGGRPPTALPNDVTRAESYVNEGLSPRVDGCVSDGCGFEPEAQAMKAPDLRWPMFRSHAASGVGPPGFSFVV
jgi:hypothetical protein